MADQCTTLTRDVSLLNRLGMHLRVAMVLAKTAKSFSAKITIGKDGMEMDARSGLGLLTMGIQCGTRLRLRAEGADAEQALDTLEQLFLDKFDEE